MVNVIFGFWQLPVTSFISTTSMESSKIVLSSGKPWSAVLVTKLRSLQRIGFVCIDVDNLVT